MLKKILHKLLFATALSGLLLSCTNEFNTLVIESNLNETLVSTHKKELNKLSFYHEALENNDTSDFFYEESELENDIDFDGMFFDINSKIYTSSVTENQKLYNKTSFYLLQKTNPLYDMFCNWKHHLS